MKGFNTAVPINVRQVERNKNTIVDDNGRDGPDHYAVCERASIKYVAFGNPQPKGPKMFSYGAPALVKPVTTDLFADLLDVYLTQDTYWPALSCPSSNATISALPTIIC